MYVSVKYIVSRKYCVEMLIKTPFRKCAQHTSQPMMSASVCDCIQKMESNFFRLDSSAMTTIREIEQRLECRAAHTPFYIATFLKKYELYCSVVKYKEDYRVIGLAFATEDPMVSACEQILRRLDSELAESIQRRSEMKESKDVEIRKMKSLLTSVRNLEMAVNNRIADFERERSSRGVDILCPITQERIIDPVIAEDGHTYEKAAILQWFAVRSTSPVTGLHIGRRLMRNYAVYNLIHS